MSLLELAILTGATWRLAYMLTAEDGPWTVFRRLRKRLHAGEFWRETPDALLLTEEELTEVMTYTGDRAMLGELLSCMYCTSVWVAGAVVAAHLYAPGLFPLWAALAVSAAALALHEQVFTR